MRTRVYIAGPMYSSGTLEDNVHNAVVAARQLIGHGYAPLVPHLNTYVDPQQDYGHRRWLENDLAWLHVADAVYRLPGESVGADEEVAYAQKHGIPVFYDIPSLAESVSRFSDETKPLTDRLNAQFDALEQLEQAGFHRPVLTEEDFTDEEAPNDPIIAMLEGMHTDISGFSPHPSSRRFYELIAEMAEVHARKQADYGRSDDPFFNVRSSSDWGMPAWVAAMVRATDKVKRLQQFAQTGTLSNEGARDSLIDLANYAIIALVLLEDEQIQNMRQGLRRLTQMSQEMGHYDNIVPFNGSATGY